MAAHTPARTRPRAGRTSPYRVAQPEVPGGGGGNPPGGGKPAPPDGNPAPPGGGGGGAVGGAPGGGGGTWSSVSAGGSSAGRCAVASCSWAGTWAGPARRRSSGPGTRAVASFSSLMAPIVAPRAAEIPRAPTLTRP